MDWVALGAAGATTLLSTAIAVYFTLQALENNHYGFWVLKLVPAKVPGGLGTVFFYDRLPFEAIAGLWITYCVIVTLPLLIDIARRLPNFIRENPHKRQVHLKDFQR